MHGELSVTTGQLNIFIFFLYSLPTIAFDLTAYRPPQTVSDKGEENCKFVYVFTVNSAER